MVLYKQCSDRKCYRGEMQVEITNGQTICGEQPILGKKSVYAGLVCVWLYADFKSLFIVRGVQIK